MRCNESWKEQTQLTGYISNANTLHRSLSVFILVYIKSLKGMTLYTEVQKRSGQTLTENLWTFETDHKKRRAEIMLLYEKRPSEMGQDVNMSEKSFISMTHKLLFR